MSKKNAFIERQKIAGELRAKEARLFAIQLSSDLMLAMLHTEFGFGEKRCSRAIEGFKKLYRQFSEELLDEYYDSKRNNRDKSDPIIKTQSDLETILKQACGEQYIPREERYRLEW